MIENQRAYPLYWPIGWKRTQNPKKSLYKDKTVNKARKELMREVALLGGEDVIISSNLELRMDGLPRSKQSQPIDKGVAVYFRYKRKTVSFACDKWQAVEDNLWAINLAISAIRTIERSGVSEMLDRAFNGFAALPAPENWWDVLGVKAHSSTEEIKNAYKQLAMKHHPDHGGDSKEFHRIQAAYETVKAERNF